jgi:hypothetical protein
MQPNTLTRREYKGKFMLKILEKIHVGSEKIIGSTHWVDPLPPYTHFYSWLTNKYVMTTSRFILPHRLYMYFRPGYTFQIGRIYARN